MTTHRYLVHIADPDTGLVWEFHVTESPVPTPHATELLSRGQQLGVVPRRVRVGPVHAATPHASAGTKHTHR